MPLKIFNLDEGLLQLLDRLVLWLWNQFSLRRITLIRAGGIVMLFTNVFENLARNELQFRFGDYVFVFVVLVMLFFEEVWAARVPPRLANIHIEPLRANGFFKLLRWWLILTVVLSPLAWTESMPWWLVTSGDLSVCVTLFLTCTYTPEQPPKRKKFKLPKFKLSYGKLQAQES